MGQASGSQRGSASLRVVGPPGVLSGSNVPTCVPSLARTSDSPTNRTDRPVVPGSEQGNRGNGRQQQNPTKGLSPLPTGRRARSDAHWRAKAWIPGMCRRLREVRRPGTGQEAHFGRTDQANALPALRSNCHRDMARVASRRQNSPFSRPHLQGRSLRPFRRSSCWRAACVFGPRASRGPSPRSASPRCGAAHRRCGRRRGRGARTARRRFAV
jgi:hypothetical protein